MSDRLDHLELMVSPLQVAAVPVVDTPFEEILARSGIGVWRWDDWSGRVVWDDVMQRLCGLEPGSFDETFEAWLATLHPSEIPAILSLVDGAVQRRSPYAFEHRVVWPDGSEHWLECRGQVVVDDDGAFIGTVGCAVDISARKRNETERERLLDQAQAVTDRLERLERLSRALTAASSTEEVAEAAVALTEIPATAVGRGLWLVDDAARQLRLVAAAGTHADSMRQYPTIDLHASLPAAIAFRTRRPVTSSSPRDATSRFPELEVTPRTASSFVVLPLVAGSHSVGVLAIGHDHDMHDTDRQFLEAVTDHVAQTLERVRLSEALEMRAHEAEQAATSERLHRIRLELLGRINDALAESRSVQELMEKVTRAAVPWFGDWCSLFVLPESGSLIPEVRVATADLDDARRAAELQADYPYDPSSPVGVARVIRTGRTEFYPDLTDAVMAALPVDERRRSLVEQLGWRSAISVPLMKYGQCLGALQFAMGEHSRRYTDDDVSLSLAVAARVASSIMNSRLTDQQRLIAKTLQASLLPERLATIDGVETAVRYWAAGAGTEVGGDFYDVFDIGDGRVAAVIGDICGTGSAAAALTAMARHTVRASLRRGDDVQEAFELLNRELLDVSSDRFLTIASVVLEPKGGAIGLRVCSAGHPLPIVVRAGAGADVLGRPGTLIGVFPHTTVHLVEDQLAPGDTLVLYTDGVTDVPPPAGLSTAQLLELVADEVRRATSADEAADGIGQRIEAILPIDHRADDIALLVLHATGTPEGTEPPTAR